MRVRLLRVLGEPVVERAVRTLGVHGLARTGGRRAGLQDHSIMAGETPTQNARDFGFFTGYLRA